VTDASESGRRPYPNEISPMRSPALLLSLLVLADVVVAQRGPSDSTTVAATVRAFHEALARGDSTAALALLAPDVIILESGGREDLDEYRAHHLSADIEFARSVPSRAGPMQVTFVGDVAWASSTSETTGTFRERPISSVGAELIVLSRHEGGWRIRAIHWSSRTRRTPPPA
jgi:ketosteroid isomerase-like protein